MRSPRGMGGATPASNAPRGPVVTPGVQPGAQAQLVASRVLIIGTGGELLVFSPTAAAGNLIFSVAAKPGTDQFGDAFFAGAASYTQLGTAMFRAVVLAGGGVTFYSAGSAAGPWTSTASITVDASSNMQLVATGGIYANGVLIS